MVGETLSATGGSHTDPDLKGAIEASHLRSLPPDLLSQLVAEAWRSRIPAGSIIRREGDSTPHIEVAVSGLIRVYVTALDGRTMTVRYVRRGGLMGAISLFASPFYLPATIQAVTDTQLLGLRPGKVQAAAERDARVARVLIDELTERVMAFIGEIPGSAFASVPQRVARHLLDLASEQQEGSELVATIVQQDLAEAVGTVREVVVRALRDFRREGLIRTERRGIVLLDPERLAAESYPLGMGRGAPRGGTKVADR